MATIVGGGIDRVFIPELPSPVPVQILCATRLVATNEEVSVEPAESPDHTLASRVHGPGMNLVSELEEPFGLHGVFDPTIEPAVILPIGVVFQPEEEGQHTVEIAVDDRGFSFPMTVVLGQGPPPPA